MQTDGAGAKAAFSDGIDSAAPVRLLVFADRYGASQAIAFVEGLAGARARGEVAVRIIDEEALQPTGVGRTGPRARETIAAEFALFRPTAVILSRFALAGAYEAVRDAAAERDLPVLYHIDDDLLDLPAATGVERFREARHPRRLHAVARSLNEADLVIAATPALAAHLAPQLSHARIGWLENGTGGVPRPRAKAKAEGEPLVVGYMGSASHGPDLEMIAPALNAILQAPPAFGPKVRIELFGSIARQPAADLLPGSVARRDAVGGDYRAFKHELRALGWDIGLAPLRANAYNRCKTATKWAEYAEAGVAVIASDIEVYGPMFQAGAAFPASALQWEHALRRLICDPGLREELTSAADALLAASFGWDRLEASLLGLVRRARPVRAAA